MKRKASTAIEEIRFDVNAREDFLTGFHKRKLQRAKHAREEATKREREAKVEARKILRRERKANLEKHVEEMNALLRKLREDGKSEMESSQDDEEDWNGIADSPSISHEAEYEDDDRFTTVTVEEVEISREGFHRAGGDSHRESDQKDEVEDSKPKENEGQDRSSSKRTWTKDRSRGPKKKKKFRYESKAERKVTRLKEKSHNRKQARERKS